jgi:hypothetical protein
MFAGSISALMTDQTSNCGLITRVVMDDDTDARIIDGVFRAGITVCSSDGPAFPCDLHGCRRQLAVDTGRITGACTGTGTTSSDPYCRHHQQGLDGLGSTCDGRVPRENDR